MLTDSRWHERKAMRESLGTISFRQRKSLPNQLRGVGCNPCDIATWPGETRHKPVRYRTTAGSKDDTGWMSLLSWPLELRSVHPHEDIDFEMNQILGQLL